MKRYTKKLHAYRLTLMMKKNKPYGYCPAMKGFIVNISTHDRLVCPHECVSEHFLRTHYPFGKLKYSCCEVCTEFVGIRDNSTTIHDCPCDCLGEEEALKRTRKALKEFYRKEIENAKT